MVSGTGEYNETLPTRWVSSERVQGPWGSTTVSGGGSGQVEDPETLVVLG